MAIKLVDLPSIIFSRYRRNVITVFPDIARKEYDGRQIVGLHSDIDGNDSRVYLLSAMFSTGLSVWAK